MSLTIKGQSVTEISNLFITKMNARGLAITPLNDEFFEVHDCIHYFTTIGVSYEEEVTVLHIQKHFLDDSYVVSAKARVGINFLKQQGVYEELKTVFIKAHVDFQAQIAAI